MKSAKVNFLLYGINGTYNYGCEAIVRGTVHILRKEWGEGCEITYLSRRAVEDSKNLQDVDLRIVSMGSKWRPHYLFGAIGRKLGFQCHAKSLLPEKELEKADVALCIGGDVYDPDSHYLREFSDKAEKYGAKVVYWGGSFPAYDKTSDYTMDYSDHLKSLSLITVREKASQEFLKNQGISNNVYHCADPAFCMTDVFHPLPFHRSEKEIVIGVNLSPLSSSLIHEERQLEDMVDEYANTLSNILKDKPRIRLILIPHVISPSTKTDDDYSFLKRIRNKISDKSCVFLLEPDLGAQRTKAVLKQCDLVISARMHCCIAALSAGVPTILLSYSIKARGMAEFVYGSREWVLPLGELKAETLSKLVDSLLQVKTELHTMLLAKSGEWKKHSELAGPVLRDSITSHRT